jgi:hypothetical protein
MIGQGDTWAFSGVKGFPAKKLDWFLQAEPPRKRFERLLDPRRDREAVALAW